MSSIAVPMPALNITRAHVGQALRQMREECRYATREVTALNKAATELDAVDWQWNGDELVISSRTVQHQRYHVQHNGCDCQAGKRGIVCWHMGAFVLLNRAAQIALTPPKPRQSDAEYAAALAACDDLF